MEYKHTVGWGRSQIISAGLSMWAGILPDAEVGIVGPALDHLQILAQDVDIQHSRQEAPI